MCGMRAARSAQSPEVAAISGTDLDQLSGLLVLPRKKEFPIQQMKDRSARRDRQARELEQNQNDLRASIAESKRLVDEAEEMIRRHRDECEAADGRS